MSDEHNKRPSVPDLPQYLIEPLERQSPERLETIAAYAVDLAAWKRTDREASLEKRREAEEIDKKELEELQERDIPTDPAEYDDVPASGAYITVKTTKQTGEKAYNYYYWQWREGDTWKNEYIAPVQPRE